MEESISQLPGTDIKGGLQGPDSFGTGQVRFTWEWSPLWNSPREASIVEDISAMLEPRMDIKSREGRNSRAGQSF